MNIGFFAFVFELVLLCACASLCASFLVDLTPHDPSQTLPEWQRVGDLAAAAAAAAVEEVCPSPSRETVQVIKVAARAATAATATALGGDPMQLADVPSGAFPAREQRTADGAGSALRGQAHSGREHGRTQDERHGDGATGPSGGGGARRAAQEVDRGEQGLGRGIERTRLAGIRKRRTPISLSDKLSLIALKNAGHSLAKTLSVFTLSISRSAARGIYKKRADYKRRAATAEEPSSFRLRRSHFEQISKGLWEWYSTLQRLGARHGPASGALLEARAKRIAREQGVEDFQGSRHFVQNCAKRNNLSNIALWGQGGSADMEGAAERISEIRAELEAYPAVRIYNMDETGLFSRCIPNRSYVEAGRRRHARGTKAMKAKDRVTFVLACNATGSHKIPVAMIGKAKQPLCFQPPRRPCPLPYFSQKSAWMDAEIFKSWFETVFLPAVRARTTLPVALLSDNCGAHDDLESEQVKFIALPPNCTSVYQPLDLGIIACLKRQYKRQLLDLVVEAFRFTATNQAIQATGSVSAAPVAASSRDRPSDAGVQPPRAAVQSEATSDVATLGAARRAGHVEGGAGVAFIDGVSPTDASLAGAGVADAASGAPESRHSPRVTGVGISSASMASPLDARVPGIGVANASSAGVVDQIGVLAARAGVAIAGVAGQAGHPVVAADAAGGAATGPRGLPLEAPRISQWLTANGTWHTIEAAPSDEPARPQPTAADVRALRATVQRAARLAARRVARNAIRRAAGGERGRAAPAYSSAEMALESAAAVTAGASDRDVEDAAAAEPPRADLDFGGATEIDGASRSGAVEGGPGI